MCAPLVASKLISDIFLNHSWVTKKTALSVSLHSLKYFNQDNRWSTLYYNRIIDTAFLGIGALAQILTNMYVYTYTYIYIYIYIDR